MHTKDELFDLMNGLKLTGMLQALDEQYSSKSFSKKSFIDRMHHLLEAQQLWNENRRLSLNQKQANLRWPSAAVSDIDFEVQKSLDKDVVWNLAEMSWVEAYEHLFLNGPTGSGKTHFACALANAAMVLGHKALFLKYSALIALLCKASKEESIEALYRKFNKVQLFIIDELRPVNLEEGEDQLLFDFFESRDMKASFIFTSQYPLSDWYDDMADETIADAILDRVVHNSTTIVMNEKVSLRKVLRSKQKSYGGDE